MEARPVEDLATAAARLKAELHDLRTTLMARVQTGMTGDIEPTVRTAAKNGTLLLQGQTVNRADYPALWQWVQDQNLDGVAGLFGTGNGSTTFVLPDFRGRFVTETGTLGSDTYDLGDTGGAARVQQTIAQMARHSHTGVTSSDGAHLHDLPTDTSPSSGAHVHTSGLTNTVADHAHAFAGTSDTDLGHYHAQGNSGSGGGGSHTYRGRWGTTDAPGHYHYGAPDLANFPFANATNHESGNTTYTSSDPGAHVHDLYDTNTVADHTHSMPSAASGGNHNHTFGGGGTGTGGGHLHTLPDTDSTPSHNHGYPLDGGTSGGSGPGAAMDIRPPYIAMNWLIWT